MKRLILITSLLLFSIIAWAAEITQEQARNKALQFLSNKQTAESLIPAETQSSRRRAQGIAEPNYYYVFNVGDEKGFVIVSADDRAVSILGYTDKGSFDVDQLPPNMTAWLQGYSEQIRYIQEHDIQPTTTQNSRRAMAAIAPLIKTLWAQGSPYNDDLPTADGEKCITGCVATAMAQVMYYHKYPTETTKEIPGYTSNTLKIQMDALSPTTFDWESMALTYNNKNTASQRAAVAHLMKYCSTAVHADLTPSGTTAYTYQQLRALRNYFGYSKYMSEKVRSNYNLAKWEDLMYNELSAGRPVLYRGDSGDGKVGHAFVLDGYDGENFHFNWGWRGSYDGYFALTAMTPSGDNFSYNQTAIIGIEPAPKAAPQTYNEDIRLTTDIVDPAYGWKTFTRTPSYDGIGRFNVRFTAKISSHLKGTYDIDNNYAVYKDGEFMEYVYFFNVENPLFGINREMQGDDFFPYNYEEMLTLPGYDRESGTSGKSFQEPGTYKLVPVSRQHGEIEWKENHNSNKEFLVFVLDENDMLTIYDGEGTDDPEPEPEPEVSEEQRQQLTNNYNNLKLLVEASQSTVNNNSQSIGLLKKQVESLTTTLTSIEDRIQTLLTKLTNSTLTEVQKTDFTNQLNELKKQKDDKQAALEQLSEQVKSAEDSNEALKKQLSDILATILQQQTAVKDITTTKALEESKAKVEELKNAFTNCKMSNINSELETIQSKLGAYSLSDIETSLKTLETAIDEEIAKAQEPDNPETPDDPENPETPDDPENPETPDDPDDPGIITDEERMELTSLCYQAQVLIENRMESIADNEKVIANSKEVCSQSAAMLTKIDSLLNVIEESLKNCQLTETQAIDFSTKLSALKSIKEDYNNALMNLTTATTTADDANNTSKTRLNEILSAILELASKEITTWEELNAALENAKKMHDEVENTNPSELIGDIAAMSNKLNMLSAEQLITQLTTLQTDIQHASGITTIRADENEILGYYDLNGCRINENYKGVIIIRMKNGMTIKYNKQK